MFETRRWPSRQTIQALTTLLIIPYLFPLIVMVQGSLSGQGWGNYRAVFAVGAVPTFFRNSTWNSWNIS